MRKLFGRRWVTIGLLAAGLVGLTASSAFASVEYNTDPPTGSLIVGPGCWVNDWGSFQWVGPLWQPIVKSGDYTGPDVYYDYYGEGTCDGTTYYTLDQATADGWFEWYYNADQPYRQNCQIYAYIPSQMAGDLHARYDFYARDNSGNLTWLAWPGATVDQEDNSRWAHIGGAIVPAYTRYLVVRLSDADPQNPGWYVGAGDMAFDCTVA